MERNKEPEPRRRNEGSPVPDPAGGAYLQALGLVGGIGLQLTVSLWVGYALGGWADSWFKTGHLLQGIGALLGGIAGMVNTVRMAKRAEERKP